MDSWLEADEQPIRRARLASVSGYVRDMPARVGRAGERLRGKWREARALGRAAGLGADRLTRSVADGDAGGVARLGEGLDLRLREGRLDAALGGLARGGAGDGDALDRAVRAEHD